MGPCPQSLGPLCICSLPSILVPPFSSPAIPAAPSRLVLSLLDPCQESISSHHLPTLTLVLFSLSKVTSSQKLSTFLLQIELHDLPLSCHTPSVYLLHTSITLHQKCPFFHQFPLLEYKCLEKAHLSYLPLHPWHLAWGLGPGQAPKEYLLNNVTLHAIRLLPSTKSVTTSRT